MNAALGFLADFFFAAAFFGAAFLAAFFGAFDADFLVAFLAVFFDAFAMSFEFKELVNLKGMVPFMAVKVHNLFVKISN